MTHQLVRMPLGTISTFITRSVLRLPKSSVADRYANVVLVFFLSGAFHAVLELLDARGLGPVVAVQTLSYYVICGMGILVEDAAQSLWRLVTGAGPRSKDEPLPLWHKVVGYLWVMVFFTAVGPIFAYPIIRMPNDRKMFSPVSAADHVGVQVVQGLLVAGGIGLFVGAGGEP